MIKNAIIFAAGKGTRLSPLTEYTPKPLIKVSSGEDNLREPIIERNIKFLIESGIKKITIVVGYLAEQFNYLKTKYNVNIIKNEKYNEENNISSLAVSLNEIEDTLYIEGDIYLKRNIIKDLIQQIEDKNYESVFFGSKDAGANEWAYVIKNNKIIKHKLITLKEEDYKWTGFAFLSKSLCDKIRENFKEYYKNYKNKQSYFETFIWTLKETIWLGQIDKNDFYELDNFSDLVKIDDFYKTQDEIKLWTPGPTNIDNNIGSLFLKGIVHHRSQLAVYYIKSLVEKLKRLFETKKGLPLLITASGTGIMEATIQNLINEGDEVIAISSGDFGDRFIELLELYKAKIHKFRYPNNTSYNINDFKDLIPKVKAVFITHHETSTGVLHNIEQIGNLTKNTDTLFIVDSVSSIVNEELKFDEWGIDAAFASSAKAFSLAPGFSVVCLSEKAIEKSKECKNKSYYFNFQKYIDTYQNKKQTPFTPAISLIVSMNASIEIMENVSYEKIRIQKQEIYDYLNSNLEKLGFINSIPLENRTKSMLCMTAPDNLDCLKMRNYIANKKLIYFEVGRNEMATKSIRIGISNTLNMDDAVNLYKSIKNYIGLTNN
ncbi:aminotransferase class V-fold PLP-dependent enzyme [Mycoplasmopsis lipofaciens]|uniref:aminotransferase class V-fold PLP-dependent enzyme n=1 Tax=Mycoplasmopsis lipofaciens TaxID=114884 RepID=UPI00068F64C7|nr:aminotransferase class V-fold PLP-dependent enzyme [Mycoplasmopsis lipofaciens]